MARFTQPNNGGGSTELPQGLGTNSSPTFDKIYITNNGSGTDVYIGDDIILGDVDIANFMSLRGQEDPSQAGIVFGNNDTEKIYTDGNNLNLQANNDIVLYPGSSYAYLNNVVEGQRLVVQDDLKTAPQYFAYGSFHDQTTFGPYPANTEHAFSYQTTDMSNDVHIGGIENTQITIDRDGKFNIAFSAQMHVTSSSAIVFIWIKKNGTSLPWTNTRYDITANNPYAVPAWNFFVDAQAGDYFELFWSSPNSANVKVESITGLTGTKPNVPSMILTVNQVA